MNINTAYGNTTELKREIWLPESVRMYYLHSYQIDHKKQNLHFIWYMFNNILLPLVQEAKHPINNDDVFSLCSVIKGTLQSLQKPSKQTASSYDKKKYNECIGKLYELVEKCEKIASQDNMNKRIGRDQDPTTRYTVQDNNPAEDSCKIQEIWNKDQDKAQDFEDTVRDLAKLFTEQGFIKSYVDGSLLYRMVSLFPDLALEERKKLSEELIKIKPLWEANYMNVGHHPKRTFLKYPDKYINDSKIVKWEEAFHILFATILMNSHTSQLRQYLNKLQSLNSIKQGINSILLHACNVHAGLKVSPEFMRSQDTQQLVSSILGQVEMMQYLKLSDSSISNIVQTLNFVLEEQIEKLIIYLFTKVKEQGLESLLLKSAEERQHELNQLSHTNANITKLSYTNRIIIVFEHCHTQLEEIEIKATKKLDITEYQKLEKKLHLSNDEKENLVQEYEIFSNNIGKIFNKNANHNVLLRETIANVLANKFKPNVIVGTILNEEIAIDIMREYYGTRMKQEIVEQLKELDLVNLLPWHNPKDNNHIQLNRLLYLHLDVKIKLSNWRRVDQYVRHITNEFVQNLHIKRLGQIYQSLLSQELTQVQEVLKTLIRQEIIRKSRFLTLIKAIFSRGEDLLEQYKIAKNLRKIL